MEVDKIRTSTQFLGEKRLNPFQATKEWRIFVERPSVKCSLVINAGSEPTKEQILSIFSQHSKEFFLEV